MLCARCLLRLFVASVTSNIVIVIIIVIGGVGVGGFIISLVFAKEVYVHEHTVTTTDATMLVPRPDIIIAVARGWEDDFAESLDPVT